jgi:hypothetical protein
VLRDYGKLGDPVFRLEILPDDMHLFVLSSGGEGGNFLTFLVQYNINSHQVVKLCDYQEYAMSRMESILAAVDSKDLFIGFQNGNLIQMCVNTHTVTKDFGNVHSDGIVSMAQTRDGNWLVVGTFDGWIKKISMTGVEVTSWQLCDRRKSVDAIIMGPQDQSFFVWIYDMDLVDLVEGAHEMDLVDFGGGVYEMNHMYELDRINLKNGTKMHSFGESVAVNYDGEQKFA